MCPSWRIWPAPCAVPAWPMRRAAEQRRGSPAGRPAPSRKRPAESRGCPCWPPRPCAMQGCNKGPLSASLPAVCPLPRLLSPHNARDTRLQSSERRAAGPARRSVRPRTPHTPPTSAAPPPAARHRPPPPPPTLHQGQEGSRCSRGQGWREGLLVLATLSRCKGSRLAAGGCMFLGGCTGDGARTRRGQGAAAAACLS